MGRVYVGQTAAQLTATAGQDVSGATCLIKYRKPDGTEGSFAATIVTAATGVIRYVITSADDLDQAGIWTFWAYATFADGTVAAGEAYKRSIYSQGA